MINFAPLHLIPLGFLEIGRAALRSFIIGTSRVSKESILLAASQAAYITTLVQTGSTVAFRLFDDKQEISNFHFPEPPHSYLNRLSKLPGGVLYYLKNVHDKVEKIQ